MDLELKYVDLERKYTHLQSVQNDFNLIKNQLVSVQNKTSEISNDVIILKQLGNVKPLQEMQSLQKAVQTVSAQTHSLSLNERARRQDFLALYNLTIDSKRVLSELNTNTSNQFNNLETKTEKLEKNHNTTAAAITGKIGAMEKHEKSTLLIIQKQVNKNAERVAITAQPSSSGTVANTIMKFDDVKFNAGITNLSSFKNTGKFTCEQEGLYMISASVLSNTDGAHFFISLNVCMQE